LQRRISGATSCCPTSQSKTDCVAGGFWTSAFDDGLVRTLLTPFCLKGGKAAPPLKGGGTLGDVTSSTIRVEDMIFHSLFIGATGAGKTNALLYWLQRPSFPQTQI